MKAESPLRVDLPADADEKPSWVRVGVIAAFGFAIGVGWPRLVGARLGPSVPQDVAAASASSERARAEAASTPPGEVTAAPAAAPTPTPSPSAPAVVTPPAAMPALNVNHGVLLSCKGDDGQTMKGVSACGGLAGFDAIAQPRLRKLGACPAANSATHGKLSVLFNLDFASHRVSADVGKSSTVSDPQGFASCVKGAFQGVSLGAIDHQNPRYTIGYSVVFSPSESASPSTPAGGSGANDGVPVATVAPSPAASIAAPSAAKTSDDAQAEVAWAVAIVRDAPRTGAVVARLPRGTKVHVGASQEGWYKVEYTPGAEGWVYRSSIGR